MTNEYDMTSGYDFPRTINPADTKSVLDWRFGWVGGCAGNKGKGGAMKQKSLAEGLWRWLACDTHWPTLMSMR